MFIGIIKYQSEVIKRVDRDGILTFSFRTPKNLKVEKGKSLNINGICSTIRRFDNKNFEVDYMPETREKTTVNHWVKRTLVNLEESANLKTLLDGHIVQGHVDTIGLVKKVAPKGKSKTLTIQVPKKYMRFIPPKGSVAVDGVSLTVSKTGRNSFETALIPYTLKRTNLRNIKRGDEVNIETDLLARYFLHFTKHSS
ncbi:MAG: riboflavin synthase [Parcubacteria group bacterium Gr01-1014_107]|nr:MAG: riboflavin synthase [Parcubacteria group bacterium Gr01-1014_107]